MKSTYEELERRIAVLDLQLNLSLAVERAWETTMMLACGEDGPKSVADKFAALEAKCAALAAENAALKAAAKETLAHWAAAEPGEMEQMMDKCMPSLRVAYCETPATDAFLVEVRAQGVEIFGQYHNFSEKLLIQKEAKKFAAQLRKGVQS